MVRTYHYYIFQTQPTAERRHDGWDCHNYSRDMDGPIVTENLGENPKLGRTVEIDKKM